MELRSTNTTSVFRYLDWVTVTIYVLLVFLGAVSIYAASYDFDHDSIFAFEEFSGKEDKEVKGRLVCKKELFNRQKLAAAGLPVLPTF